MGGLSGLGFGGRKAFVEIVLLFARCKNWLLLISVVIDYHS